MKSLPKASLNYRLATVVNPPNKIGILYAGQ